MHRADGRPQMKWSVTVGICVRVWMPTSLVGSGFPKSRTSVNQLWFDHCAYDKSIIRARTGFPDLMHTRTRKFFGLKPSCWLATFFCFGLGVYKTYLPTIDHLFILFNLFSISRIWFLQAACNQTISGGLVGRASAWWIKQRPCWMAGRTRRLNNYHDIWWWKRVWRQSNAQ